MYEGSDALSSVLIHINTQYEGVSNFDTLLCFIKQLLPEECNRQRYRFCSVLHNRCFKIGKKYRKTLISDKYLLSLQFDMSGRVLRFPLFPIRYDIDRK